MTYIVEKDWDNFTFKKPAWFFDSEWVEVIRTVGTKTIEWVNKLIDIYSNTKERKLKEHAQVIAWIDEQIAKQQEYLSLMV